MATNGTEMIEDGAFAIPEAQRFSTLSRATIYNLMESGELPYIKMGRRRAIPRRALIEMMSRGLVDRRAEVVACG
jgi:excisionase family DNA binding protein